VRGIPAKTFEGGLAFRTVVIEFETIAAATAAYENPAYQDCLRVLGDAAERDIRTSAEGHGLTNHHPVQHRRITPAPPPAADQVGGSLANGAVCQQQT